MQDQDTARTLSNGEPCGYAVDEGRPEWHEHDHSVCQDAAEPEGGDEPAIPLEDVLAPIEAKRQQRKQAKELADGLRAVAGLVEAVPELGDKLWYSVKALHAPVMHTDDPVGLLATIARAGAAHGAKVSKSYDEKYGNVDVTFGPVTVQAYADREQVCERVVTGVEQVTKTVPDPVKLAEVPLVEVIEEVETVEWKCRPLLAADTATVAADA